MVTRNESDLAKMGPALPRGPGGRRGLHSALLLSFRQKDKEKEGRSVF